MSTQVLARKWRPKSFETLVGQDHVVRALTHALSSQRLHHAYLFTGTRGVGKTTLSRILAKALNCQGADGNGGITATPCGVCRACTEIDAGKFVDYIEMDAASNRGVDEMAQLLERAVYAPSAARFKIYMIDEVHMLTHHAFNAMLKTLEEPPDHIKFILATTDPQKIPVTVLSRCLQFNLKQMPREQIITHLAQILETEKIAFERPALGLIAQAAAGSMRDALSLTDQAIAYSAGNVNLEAARGMLGALDESYLVRVLDALAARDGASLVTIADEIATRSLSFSNGLQDLAQLLLRINLQQTAPQAISADAPDASELARLATLFAPAEVQLYYHIAITGRNEIGLAPDEYAGFVMTLLRMLAFAPETNVGANIEHKANSAPRSAALQSNPRARSATNSFSPPTASVTSVTSLTPPVVPPAVLPETRTENLALSPPNSSALDPHKQLEFNGDWPSLMARLAIRGLIAQLAQQSELLQHQGKAFHVRVPIKSLIEGGKLDRLKMILSEHFGTPIVLTAEVGAVQTSAAAIEQDVRTQKLAEAERSLHNDPFVKELLASGATIVPGSIRSE